MKRMVVLGAALMLALSACEIRAEIDVNEDGSGTFGFVMAVEPLLLDGLPANESPFNDFQDALREDPLPWRFEDFEEHGYKGVRATVPFTSLDDLQTQIAAMNSEGTANGIDDDLSIGKTADGGWTFRATTRPPEPEFNDGDLSPTWNTYQEPLPGQVVADPFPTAPGSGLRDTFDPQEFRAPNPLEQFEGTFRFEFHVTLPGKPSESNAGQTLRRGRRTTFVWRIEPSGSQKVDLVATTLPAPGLPIVPIGVALVALGAGAVFFLRRRPSAPAPPPLFVEGAAGQPATVGASDILPGAHRVAPIPPVEPDEELAG